MGCTSSTEVDLAAVRAQRATAKLVDRLNDGTEPLSEDDFKTLLSEATIDGSLDVVLGRARADRPVKEPQQLLKGYGDGSPDYASRRYSMIMHQLPPLYAVIVSNAPKPSYPASFADLLLERKANPAITDADGNTLLHIATSQGRLATIVKLIQLGVDPNVTNKVRMPSP